MALLRARMKVASIAKQKAADGTTVSEKIRLTAVHTEEVERAAWSAGSPGILEISLTNPEVFGAVKEGQELYLDFYPAS